MKEQKTVSMDTNKDDYVFKYCATTFEVKEELCKIIDAYRNGEIDAQTLEDRVKEYSTTYKSLIYESKKPHYFRISIYNHLGQKRLNILKNIINTAANPVKIRKAEASRIKREEKRISKANHSADN